jgi:hypothetical protein
MQDKTSPWLRHYYLDLDSIDGIMPGRRFNVERSPTSARSTVLQSAISHPWPQGEAESDKGVPFSAGAGRFTGAKDPGGCVQLPPACSRRNATAVPDGLSQKPRGRDLTILEFQNLPRETEIVIFLKTSARQRLKRADDALPRPPCASHPCGKIKTDMGQKSRHRLAESDRGVGDHTEWFPYPNRRTPLRRLASAPAAPFLRILEQPRPIKPSVDTGSGVPNDWHTAADARNRE